MLNVSAKWQRAVMLDNDINVNCFADIVTASGEKVPISDSKLWANGFEVNDSTSSSSTFTIGALIVGKLKIKLNNIYEDYSKYDFDKASVTAYVSKSFSDGTTEKLKIGEYRVSETSYDGSLITLTCLDNVNNFNREYDSNLSYPTTAYEVVRDACIKCDVPFTMARFDNSDYVINEIPSDNQKLTYGQVIAYILQLSGLWGKCGHDGELLIGWYDMSQFGSQNYNGGTFSTKTTPYSDGDTLNGGNFTDYSSGDIADGGTFTEARNYHNIYTQKDLNVATDDVVITGVKVTVTSKEDKAKDVNTLAGKEGYVVSISDNPFISADKAQTVANYIFKKIGGMRFRPLDATLLSNPLIESGDVALVTDRKQNTYSCFISNRTFTVGSGTKISCDAENASRNSADKFSNETKAIVQARKVAQAQLSVYDKQMQLLTQLMSQSLGLFKTEQAQEDGSIIYIMHNKADLNSSNIQWKMTANGMAVSSDYGKTWKAGIDKDGNAIFNIMSAIGINFDWAHGGTLTLGGENNVDGKQYVKDSKGNILITLDNRGITLASGVKISWNNISNQPSIPSKTSDLTNDSGYQDADQVGEIANNAVKSTKDELNALKKNIGYTQIGSDYVVSPKIVGAYGEFTKAFNVDVVNPSTGLNQSFWAQDAETGTKISGNYGGNAIDNNLTVNPEGANLFSNVGGHSSGVGCGGGYASMNGETVNISGTNVDITANNLTLNGVETVFGSKTFTNENGWYWRQWTDGYIEMWGSFPATVSFGSKYGSLYYTYGSVYMPDGVKSILHTTGTVFCSAGGLYSIFFTRWSSNELGFCINSAAAETNKQLYLQIHVLGKWK
mgnify:FL=1|jgi:hypothetical protein|nr:MAG TPA: protein of unknown function (DUF5048) [Caudoviricetes sp.]DAI85391.1 MAG TPA: protein of unknown function (DUF5048) [Caudoviricetes sp.]